MSWGAGRIQREVIALLQRDPTRWWLSLRVAAEVYEIEPGVDEWIIPDAPHAAVRRVLSRLLRQGRVMRTANYFGGGRGYKWRQEGEPATKGTSQATIAKELGVSASTISRDLAARK